jgi:exopolysaccharide biosynthesis polyprenyl glycosylphosphotransferase
LEKTGTDLCVAPALLDVAGPRTTIRPTAGLTLLHVDHPQLSGPRQVLKDLFDRSVAALALILVSPLMIAIAIAVKLSDSGPALFTQTRVGKDGRTFKIYKFRTMVVDAEKRLAELRAKNDHDGVLFKMRRDPRITAVGAKLRKWSLDELPQLFNVLLGEMSLVGPRPALPDETAQYADHVRRRLVVKPGLTGLWQVSGRSDLSWDESVRLDLRYVENWSLALDLQILWKTIAVLLRGSGAY